MLVPGGGPTWREYAEFGIPIASAWSIFGTSSFSSNRFIGSFDGLLQDAVTYDTMCLAATLSKYTRPCSWEQCVSLFSSSRSPLLILIFWIQSLVLPAIHLFSIFLSEWEGKEWLASLDSANRILLQPLFSDAILSQSGNGRAAYTFHRVLLVTWVLHPTMRAASYIEQMLSDAYPTHAF